MCLGAKTEECKAMEQGWGGLFSKMIQRGGDGAGTLKGGTGVVAKVGGRSKDFGGRNACGAEI